MNKLLELLFPRKLLPSREVVEYRVKKAELLDYLGFDPELPKNKIANVFFDREAQELVVKIGEKENEN